MPVITEQNVQRETEGGVCGPVTMLRYSDSGELTQFGAILEILPPGSRSAIKHWHSDEDEMVYVLEGTVTLHEGDDDTVLGPGDAATFKAGEPRGHCLENLSDRDVRYLVIGTRALRDRVIYPDDDRILHRDRQAGTTEWTDSRGAPSHNPYEG